MQADILRKKFLDFFQSKKHKIVESDSLVPADDPTVLFTPAGMNQFKKEFLGFDSGFSRAATAQRCLRTDDLDKVGKTSYHHTFFEMLGNFSFGDYFKKEAISYAFEFLTQELKIDKEKLWVSVYKEDDEAYQIWKDLIKIPESKIIKLGDKENFWPSEAKAKGPNGPCGPCSEIFFDQGSNIGCKKSDCTPACDCGRFVEVWNLVFTQYLRSDGGILKSLPKKNIDTGMGLERLAAVIQGVKNNFETDLFQPLVKEIISAAVQSPNLVTVYAIADHIRAITFAIYDGVLPSNEERGYVIRKLIRRSCLHLRALGVKKPYLYKLVPVVADIMKEPYPELLSRKENISEIILAEEKSFISTIESSPSLFKEKFKDIFKKQDQEKAGFIAFQLYDTYGIPFELTKNWADQNGIQLSFDRFNKELEEQKSRSKHKSAMKGEVFKLKDLHLGKKETRFQGYLKLKTKAKVLKIIKDNLAVKKISKGEGAEIILDKTVLYAEAGGQVGDTGEIIKGKNIFKISNTQKADKVILHLGEVIDGAFKEGDEVLVFVNTRRRLSIARNHTATHLLQAALRKALGVHVQQQGSWVGVDRLRFDFTHFKDITKDELLRIEEIVNDYILNNHPLAVQEMPLSKAKKSGALAFFAEKYAGEVRVVSIGDFSKELCGGTHLDSTGQIGIFRIIEERSVASGIRRIEATTGNFAYKMIKEEEGTINEISSLLNTSNDKIIQELGKKISRLKELEKELNVKKFNTFKSSLDSLVQGATDIKGIKVIAREIENMDMDLLRKSVDLIKENITTAVIALGSTSKGKAILVMGVTDDLCQRGMDASKLIRDVAKIIGGSGGGRKDFAQAGGDKPQNLAKGFEELKNTIQNT
ncbi:MAG: alanine--tRNA ligase [Candidatus Omnitrophica bacterium]|nr:alanine--tRNA ligase [Candidatus Omnitrophota bacterium]MDD5237632.1 alanine--tRNA ligase [Candidatus Omnitrophota bacterium]